MSSDAKITANRANAQLSTGPTTSEGKAKSSLNAGLDEAAVFSEPKTQARCGLTGRTVLLPNDDAEAYAQHVQRLHHQYEPASDAETTLVQSLADTEWRLLRIPSLEAGIYALGRLELAELFPDQDEAVRRQLIEAKIFLTYQRQLNNLSIQENRLRRQCEKDAQKLEQLQSERMRAEETRIKKEQESETAKIRAREQRLNQAAQLFLNYWRKGKAFNPAEFGFEFSIRQVQLTARDISSQYWKHTEDNPQEIAPADHPKAA